MPAVRPWPELLEEDKWLIGLMEEQFEKAGLSAGQLRARAAELRQQADDPHLCVSGEMALALAERYEIAAATRRAAR
jgi:hypothetical protein